MNYKEKYEKALERARKLHSEPTGGTERIVCEQIFPELMESADERIRKALTTYFQSFPYQSLASVGINAKEAIAWLEKQGEQKPIWSEEDRAMAFTLMRDIDQMSYVSKEGKDERIGWLNSLDERFTPTEPA